MLGSPWTLGKEERKAKGWRKRKRGRLVLGFVWEPKPNTHPCAGHPFFFINSIVKIGKWEFKSWTSLLKKNQEMPVEIQKSWQVTSITKCNVTQTHLSSYMIFLEKIVKFFVFCERWLN